MATITFFTCGYCLHPAAIAVQGESLRARRFPAQAALIETNGRRWLWDTGYGKHFFTATRKPCYALYRTVTPVYYRREDSLCVQLAARGINNLHAILLSHYHADHIGGLRDFPGLPVYAPARGFAKIRRLHGLAALRHGFLPDLIPADFDTRLHPYETLPVTTLPSVLAPFHHGWALPGSGGEIIIVELPGHAAGHSGAFVHTAQGWQLLAADAAFARANYRGRPPSPLVRLIHDDPHAYRNLHISCNAADTSSSGG